MPRYETTFTINATPEAVWKVLTDYNSYGKWNPQIVQLTGPRQQGSTIQLKLKFPRRPGIRAKARLEIVDAPKRLVWKGNIVASFVFQGERDFVIESAGDSAVSFTHVENITGLLAPVFSLAMGGPVRASHEAMNDAFKERCEAG